MSDDMIRGQTKVLLILAATAASFSLIGVACSDTGNPPASGALPDAAGADRHVIGADGDSGLVFNPPDAADGAVTCPVPAFGGAVVNGRILNGSPPADTGGTITPGTYDLTDLEVYDGASSEDDGGVDAGATDHAQATFVITSDMMQLARSAASPISGGASIVTMFIAKQHVSDVFLVLDDTCPGTDSRQIPFTATATTMTLHSSQLRREIYTRRP